MTSNKLFSGYQAVQDWSRVAVHRCLHRTGTSSWQREVAQHHQSVVIAYDFAAENFVRIVL